jgi:mono/diheme cytochrome c family protein
MRRRPLVACALALAALLACDAGGDRSEVAATKRGGPGQILYLTYCESCHGVGGAGNGPAAASLRTPPADLTRLFERYGTPLDREGLAEYIDGRRLMTFHSARDMPIWGKEFFEDAPADTPNLGAVKRRLIEVLIEHLESLQAEQRT